ncbi:MAG: Grx4 family monothiol glutaredoxin [Candidatus Mycalebacterium zealandia]|nr:MAG: Grx4 family monothiol glutaredoxin [Candidatus Mycalebacterium zealandia]
MSEEIKNSIKSQVENNPVILFMKGTREMPECGFSARVVQILNTLGVPYETVNVLENEEIRQGIKEFSNWPTIPQLYIDGNFIGGCDICEDMFRTGELKQTVESAEKE